MESDFYFKFENQFRGTREEIISRLSTYDGLISYILNKFQNPNLLDIGCGRGEWIEKCSNFGITSIGMEADERMISYCEGQNFTIIPGNALHNLNKVESDSFCIVSAFHVIEHLTYKDIYALLQECKRILRPDGVLILETPSIDNIQVATRTFHLDPTHITPVNPDALIFILESIGFDRAKYYLINGIEYQKKNFKFSLNDVLESSGKDACFFATIYKEPLQGLFEEEEIWTKSINFSKSTSELAISFDDQLYVQNTTIREQANKISLLEKDLEYIKFRQDRLFNNFFANFYRSLKKIIMRICNSFKAFIIYFSHLLFKILWKNSHSKKSLFIFKLFANILRIIGLNKHSSRLLNKLNVANQTVKESSNLNNKLIDYFNSSPTAQRIYTRIKSKKN